MRRRFLLILVGLFAVGITIVGSLPLWLGVALRTLGPRWGVKIGSYERAGYAHFVVRDAEYRRANVRVTATRIAGDTPVLWLWRRWTGNADSITAERWAVDVQPPAVGGVSAVSTPPAGAGGWMPLRATLRRVAAVLDRWLPRAKTGDGVVHWPGGSLSIGAAVWEKRTLTTEKLIFGPLTADVSLELPANADELRLSARVANAAGTAALRNRGADVAGDISWWEQPASITAHFGEHGWLPTEALLKSDAWNVPGARFGLGDLYSAIRGRGRIEWHEGQFNADLNAASDPASGKKAPPLEATLRGHGDTQTFTVEALHANLPGVVADLTEPVTVDRQGKFRAGAARFSVQADLAKQSWIDARGSVAGEAQLVSNVAQSPVVDFRLTAHDVAAKELALTNVELNGRFDWPRLQIASGVIVGTQGERLALQGGWDFRAKELRDAAVEGRIRRTTIARWLPAQPLFEAISINAEASGSLSALTHKGTAKVAALSFRGLNPLDAALTWTGSGTAIEKFTVDAAAGGTKLSAVGSADTKAVTLTELELFQKGASQLRLSQAATVQWSHGIQIEALRLAGSGRILNADFTWGPTGRVALTARKIPSALLADLVEIPGPAWSVTSLQLTGDWDRGPMTFSADLGTAIELGEGRTAAVNLTARGDKSGVRLEALRAAEGTQSIVNATGTLPMTLNPGADSLLKMDSRATLAVDAETAPNAAFWQEIAVLSGLELVEPRASVHIKGGWDRPEGEIRVKADRVAADPKRFKRPLPAIDALDIAVLADRDGARLDTFSFKVEGQAVSAQGRLPIAGGDWGKAFREPVAFVQREADLRIEISDADLTVFARFLPTFLAPKGRLHVDVNYKAGAFDGSLRLSDAATRPLGPLGVLQEVEADVRLVGRAIELKSVTAKSGGEEVRLTGRVELPPVAGAVSSAAATGRTSLAQTLQPKFDLAMKGENLPFVRQTGLLVRGDLDLKLASPANGPPRLSGSVRLRDSLFLQDVRALLPGGARTKTRRPPYFAIENPPLDEWQLDVNVAGDGFMRLRTTVVSGVASARFHLGGTLGEPFALGEATLAEGHVRLPFATFDVQEARVTLTTDRPYEPQIYFSGTARRLNYDLRMEMSGAASAPLLTFSSTPPLDHGQVLLMVMAGEAPKDEVTFSDRQRAARLGAFVGQSLLASFGDTTSADRLSITTGEKVSRQGRETYNVEYRWTDRWSAVGEIDEFDDVNAGVKWRVYSKGGSPRDEVKHEKESR